MAIRIGEDGTIINNGEEEITSSRTVIRDDGTIESSGIASVPNPQRTHINLSAPVSPLENGGGSRNVENQQPERQAEEEQLLYSQRRERDARNAKSVADLEYELMVAEGHVRGSISKTPIIVGIITLLLGVLLHPVFLIGVAGAGIILFTQYSKKSSYEKEAQRIRSEISRIKQQ